MNDFDENTWSKEQQALDMQLAAEFESFEGSRWTEVEMHGRPFEEWQREAAPTAEALRAAALRLEHARRCAHWLGKLEELGFPPPPEPVPEPVPEPEPRPQPNLSATTFTGAEDPPSPAPSRRKPRGGGDADA